MTGQSLAQQVRTWPTPTVNGNHNRKGSSKESGDGLATAVKSVGGTSTQQIGPLNPPWVAWLMGWPIGWTESKPLEMDRFRQWWLEHGMCSQETSMPEVVEEEDGQLAWNWEEAA
jgi:DNA (cytosine-5)-methyltransferase 1